MLKNLISAASIKALLLLIALLICSFLTYGEFRRTEKYETLCLIEHEHLVTYRGTTFEPSRGRDGIWYIQDHSSKIAKKVPGDCFYRRAQ